MPSLPPEQAPAPGRAEPCAAEPCSGSGCALTTPEGHQHPGPHQTTAALGRGRGLTQEAPCVAGTAQIWTEDGAVGSLWVGTSGIRHRPRDSHRRGRAAGTPTDPTRQLDSLSLYPRDDGAEGCLDISRGARAHHGQRVPLQDLRQELGASARGEPQHSSQPPASAAMPRQQGGPPPLPSGGGTPPLPQRGGTPPLAQWGGTPPTPPAGRNPPTPHCREDTWPLPTCPCQSEVLTRMMFSGSWSSEMRMWFNWSYTVFLGIWRHKAHPCWWEGLLQPLTCPADPPLLPSSHPAVGRRGRPCSCSAPQLSLH